jgi:hypothetical protein
VDPKPERIWYFAGGERLGLPVAGYANSNCEVGTFGSVIWEWLMGLLGEDES